MNEESVVLSPPSKISVSSTKKFVCGCYLDGNLRNKKKKIIENGFKDAKALYHHIH